jgi:hypothetical protein
MGHLKLLGLLGLGAALVCMVGCAKSQGADDASVPDAMEADGAPVDAGGDADPPTGPTCAALEVEGVGTCRALLGFGWNGRACISLSGCDCEGRDCDALHPSLEACKAAHDACAPCEAMDVQEVGSCEPVRGYFFDGEACVLLSGCACEGDDCDRVYGSMETCEAAYRACLEGSPHGCRTDGDCEEGAEWCVDGECVPCDDTGTACDIGCSQGWDLYSRNGCTACECAPINVCDGSADCAGSPQGEVCVPGRFCTDWCPEGDPSCCFGNVCASEDCAAEEPYPHGCFERGCPAGETCEEGAECIPTSCECIDDFWICTDDCGGGACVADG